MADGKSKPKENPNGQPDVPKLGEIKKPDVPQIIGEKTEVKKETTKGTSEIKREVLQREVNPDKDTPTKIDKLDTNGNLESKEQKEGFDLLQTVTGTTLLAMLFDQGITKETLKKFENIGGISGTVQAKLNPAERISLKKIQEIASKPGTALYSALKERWDKLVDRAKEIYDGAKKAKQSIESPKTKNAAPGQPEGEPKTFWGKIGDFAKEHPILTAGIAAAGAYGIYKIFKWFTKSDDDSSESNGEKKEGFMDKILGNKWASRLKWGLGLSAGIFVLGRLIGNEDIGKWLKDKLGINITGNRLSQFLILLSHGEFIEAFKVLFAGPDENFDVHRRMAEKISKETGNTVDPETLKGIGGIKYEDFMSTVAEGKSAIVGVLGKIPGLNLLVGSSDSAEQEKIVRQYFVNHQAEIDHFKNPTTTVDDVLTKLDGEAAPEAPSPEVKGISDAIDKLPPEQLDMGKELKLDLQKLLEEKNVVKSISEAKKLNINVEKITLALAARKQALQNLQTSIENKDGTEIIADKADKVFKLNNDLGEEYNKLRDEIMKRRGWTETALLSATHLPKFIGWAFLPAWKKEYGKYLIGKYLKAPVDLVKSAVNKAGGVGSSELIGREFKPNATSGEIDLELKKANAELEQAKKSLGVVEKQKVSETKTADQITSEVNHNKAKIALIEKDVKIHELRKAAADGEAKVIELRAKGAPANEIALAEKAIEDNKSMLRSQLKERLEKQGDFLIFEITERTSILKSKFGTEGEKGVLTKTYIEQMDTLQNSINTHKKQIDLQISDRMAEAEKLYKEGKDIKPLIKDLNELNHQKIKLDIGSVDSYQSLAKKWTIGWDLKKAMKGNGAVTPEIEQMMKTEKNQMQTLWYKILNGQSEKEGIIKSVTNISRGKLVLYGSFIALGTYINMRDKRESEAWSKALSDSALQAAIDTIPFTSTYSDFYSAIKGEEIITGRKLDATDRGIRAAFGVGSGLCDASVLAGTFMRFRAASTIMKEAKAAGKSMEIGEALKAAKGEVNDIEAFREMAKTGHWVNKVALGGALGALGYGLLFQPSATIDINPETQAIMGNQIQNVDVEPPKVDTGLAGKV